MTPVTPVTAAHRRARRVTASLCVLVAAVVPLGWAMGGASSTAGAAASLPAPKTSFALDTKFFTDVTEADPSLVSYEQQEGNVALQALLTDGSAFCAFVRRGGGIDKALVEEAEGVRSTETRTNLPLSVTTFNSIESVSLLTLCPSEQRLIPASLRAKIRALGRQLDARAG